MNIFYFRKLALLMMALFAGLFFEWKALAQEEQPAAEGAPAAEEPPVDPNAWKKQRAEIYREIAIEANKRARATITKENTVEKINKYSAQFEENIKKEENRYRRRFIVSEQNKWRDNESLPDEYPNMSKYLDIKIPEWKVNTVVQRDILKIKDDLAKDLTKIFESSCKEKSIEELELAGKKKYPMYVIEDGKKKPYVTDITLRGGRGYGARRIEGRLEVVTVNRIKIGHRMISRDDLDEATQALFYDEVNQKMVDNFILQEQRRYRAIKESFVNDWISMTFPDMLMAEGYVPKNYMINKREKKNRDERNSTNIQNWVQRNVYLDERYRVLLKLEIERITPEITKSFFENAVEKFAEKIGCEYDYEFVKEAGDPPGTGEWMPTNVAEEFRMKKEQGDAEAKPEGEEAQPQM